MSEQGLKTEHDAMVEDIWRRYLTTGEFGKERRQRHFFRLLPGAPRCKTTATQIMVRSDALIDKITGDQVVGIYVTGFAGPDYTARALQAAREILQATGHNSAQGPWIPIGIGVHAGVAFVGSVGSPQGAYDITVLGDAANTTARLASSAAQGETLLSDAAYKAIRPTLGPLEQRRLQLKGKSDSLLVHVLPPQPITTSTGDRRLKTPVTQSPISNLSPVSSLQSYWSRLTTVPATRS